MEAIFRSVPSKSFPSSFAMVKSCNPSGVGRRVPERGAEAETVPTDKLPAPTRINSRRDIRIVGHLEGGNRKPGRKHFILSERQNSRFWRSQCEIEKGSAMADYYLLKTEPSEYSFADLQRDKETLWDGVSNPVAVRNLREMKPGTKLVIYETGDRKSAVGTATVVGVKVKDPKNPEMTLRV